MDDSRARAHHALAQRAVNLAPGVLLCAALAAVATLIAKAFPLLGAALPAVALGIVVSLTLRLPDRARGGITYTSKFVLQCAVVLLGAQLSASTILTVGGTSLPVLLSSLVACLVVAWLLGRALKIGRHLRTLIGVGTGICGASAIAAIAPVIRAASSDVAYAISVIFLFNLLAVLAFPLLGHALDLDPQAFGLFAGTAVNDTSSVVAAASIYATTALGFAVVVKLVRTLAIIPISVGLALLERRYQPDAPALSVRSVVQLVPWFLIGFLLVVGLNTVMPLPEGLRNAATQTSVFMIAMALAAIGLTTDLRAVRAAGWRPLALGAALWATVTVTTLAVMRVTGSL
ncbi:putative sulfate exporter family transporter [Micrococcales bacterium 31B]|nr:putative sulfate exporter family transporter [Micrococcales bacterium 31B]